MNVIGIQVPVKGMLSVLISQEALTVDVQKVSRFL